MDFYLALVQLYGPHVLLGLSAYVVILTGQISLAQAGFYAVGAYTASMATVIWNLHIVPALLLGAVVAAVVACLVSFPALRVKGLMLVIATLAFTEIVRMFFFNFNYRVQRGGFVVGPLGGEGFKQIRYFNENGWTVADAALLVLGTVVVVMLGLWLMDRSRVGAVLRAVGEDEIAAQSVGVNLTAVKVSAMTIGGFIAGLGGGLYAHVTTHIEQEIFGILLATFAIVYPLFGGTATVFGTLLGVLFIQGFLIEALRFLGDWRSILFGALIVVMMNVRPHGLLDAALTRKLSRLLSAGWRHTTVNART